MNNMNIKVQEVAKRDYPKEKLGSSNNYSKSLDFRNTLDASLKGKEKPSEGPKEMKEVKDTGKPRVETKVNNSDEKLEAVDEKIEVLDENLEPLNEESKDLDLLSILEEILAFLGVENSVNLKLNEGLSLEEKINALNEAIIGIKNMPSEGIEKLANLMSTLKEALGNKEIPLHVIEGLSKELEGLNILNPNTTEKLQDSKNFTKKSLEEIKSLFYEEGKVEESLDNADSLETYKPLNTDSNKNQETLTKEERFLKSLIGDAEASKNSGTQSFGDNETSKPLSDKEVIPLGNINPVSISEGENISPISKEMNINSATFTKDVVKSIKYMEMNDIKELTLKVKPKELGEVIIKLSMEGNIMRAKIMATHKDTYNLLNSNLSQIKESLISQEFKVQDISVDIYFSDATTYGEFQGKDGNQREYRQGNGFNSGDMTLDDIKEEDLEEDIYKDNNINMLV
ncbi:flagellar hook-length control protein FliK [Clostridium sp.]|uniref:flagellar hook-length control protein FliK n=1 Tax=Clostridium sp. TaxID=1506 RepID=UPI003464204C